jgi:hypothetical protein
MDTRRAGEHNRVERVDPCDIGAPDPAVPSNVPSDDLRIAWRRVPNPHLPPLRTADCSVAGGRSVSEELLMRRSIVFAALVAGLLLSAAPAAFAGGVTHHVSAGGPDACASFGQKPGCDANWSLVADQYADGRVTGQYTDRSKRLGGFHAVIDCLVVVGNEAWVSGVITSGTFEGQALTGLQVTTRVRDNGISAEDPADQISFSWWGEGFSTPCTDLADYPLFDAPQGQVTVR